MTSMVPEERPFAAFAAGDHASARRARRGRLATVRTDFFLDPAARLTEQERALMTAMLHCLVSEVADDLRSALPDRRIPADEDSNHLLIERLNRAGMLNDPNLVALLLKRADEERIVAAASARAGKAEARVLQGLVGHANGAVSAAAMSLILARGRRRDRFGQCLLLFDDLPRVVAESFVHHIAAALKAEGVTGDRDLALACERVIGAHDPAKSVDSLASSLASALSESGAGTDDLMLAAANEGELALLARMLARSAEIAGSVAEDELLSGEAESVITLLRLAKTPRTVAGGILAAIGDLLGIHDPGAAMALFDSLNKQKLGEAHILLTSAPAYRSALAALENANG